MATEHDFKVKKGLQVLGGDVNLGDGFAYKIDGTTVVDSSRNLTNIGSITTTGTIQTTNESVHAMKTRFLAGMASGSGYGDGPLFIQQSQAHDVHIFYNPSSGQNRSLYLYGYDTAAASAKHGRLFVGTDGSFNITAQDTYLVLNAASYIQTSKPLNLTSTLLMNGTGVLDSSRNLSNIGTISSGAISATGPIDFQIGGGTNNIIVRQTGQTFTSGSIGLTGLGIRNTGTSASYSIFEAQTGAGTAFQVRNNGDVLVLRNLSTSALIVDGNTAINQDGSGTYMIYHDASGNAAIYAGDTSDNRNYYQSNHHRFRSDDANTNFGEISSAGWHIGGTSTPTEKLQVSGNATVSGTIAASGGTSTNWNTAYGWGNHASAGYLTGNETITLTGDVSGSGTTSINVTVANDSHTHDGRYFTESESDGRYARLSANNTFSGNNTFNGVVYGIYHAVEEDHYYFDDYNGTRNINAFLKTSRSDIIKYQEIGVVEYWNGSSWVDATSTLRSSVEKLLDGRQDTSWSVPSTYYKFRFTVTASTGWPTRTNIGMQTSWSGSAYPGCTLTVEELQTDSTWAAKVTADFTSSNGVSNWGTAFRSDSALHTGRGSQQYGTRITVDFDGWTPSNSSYTTVPLQNIFMYSNFSGTETNDYQNLLEYSRKITAPNGINIATSNLQMGGTTVINSSRSLTNIHDITFDGVVRSTNNANVDGPNFNVSTTNKSTSEYAYRVDRSGSVVGGIRIDGRLIAPEATINGSSVTSTLIGNWNNAYSWGNHASAGYLTSYTETDPTVPSHVKSITSTNISNWNTAYGWGNHASAGYLTSYTETDTLASVTGRGATTTNAISTGKITATVSSSHTTGTISTTNAALDLYNSLQANTDEKGSIITFSDNYYDGTNYIKTSRAAIKGGTDTVGNTANGFLTFYTDSGGANSAEERMRINHQGNVSINSTSSPEKFYVNGSIRADGAYKVGGTTVIDSSRNLVNIGTISSGAITSTGNIVTSQVVQGDILKLTNDATDTTRHRVSVYDSGGTSYGMMLWNTNGTSGDWSTMIYGPNQANRRISFGKVTNDTFSSHSHVTESMFLDLDNDYLYIKQRVAHYDDGDTYLQFDNNRVRLVAGGSTVFDSNNTYQTTTAPSAVSITSTSVVSETVEIVFGQSSTSGVSRYEIWSDGGGSDFSLIGKINAQDAASSMSFVDTTFTDTGTINYRVYAVRYGIYSTAATTSVSFSAPSLDVTNFSAIADLNNFYLQYEKPDSRFLDHIEIYVDTDASSSNLARSSATLIYSGDNTSYVHSISASDRNNFHQFWVECVGV